jgi:hypothetical protein
VLHRRCIEYQGLKAVNGCAFFELSEDGSAVAAPLMIGTDTHSLDLASAFVEHTQCSHGDHSTVDLADEELPTTR